MSGLHPFYSYNMKAKISVDPTVEPQFHKARPVPFALKEKVEEELKRLQREEIVQPVQFSDWAAPIVPVVKQDGSVRICGDYRLTVNRASKLDSYPLPRVEDLFAAMAGGKQYTKLDLQHAYQQLVLDDDSKPCTVINTHVCVCVLPMQCIVHQFSLAGFIYKNQVHAISRIFQMYTTVDQYKIDGIMWFPRAVVCFDVAHIQSNQYNGSCMFDALL